MLQAWRFLTLLLAALGLTMGAAHVLELAPRLAYDAALYTAVTKTLYRYFGLVGGPIQVGALVAAVILCWHVRGRTSFRWTCAGALALAVSLVLWALLVQPVNAQWGQVLAQDPGAAPARYIELRERWEYGHVMAFVAWLLGFCLLLVSLLSELHPKKA